MRIHIHADTIADAESILVKLKQSAQTPSDHASSAVCPEDDWQRSGPMVALLLLGIAAGLIGLVFGVWIGGVL
jgi:hypothetical protein